MQLMQNNEHFIHRMHKVCMWGIKFQVWRIYTDFYHTHLNLSQQIVKKNMDFWPIFLLKSGFWKNHRKKNRHRYFLYFPGFFLTINRLCRRSLKRICSRKHLKSLVLSKYIFLINGYYFENNMIWNIVFFACFSFYCTIDFLMSNHFLVF